MMASRARGKSLSQMNGDSLILLRKPVSSEYRADVKGRNASHSKANSIQIELWLKEQNFVVDKINRAQKEVYKTMVHTHFMKKKIKFEKMKARMKKDQSDEKNENYRYTGSSEEEHIERVGISADSVENAENKKSTTKVSHPKHTLEQTSQVGPREGIPTASGYDVTDLTRLMTIHVDPLKDQRTRTNCNNNNYQTYNGLGNQYEQINDVQGDIKEDKNLDDQNIATKKQHVTFTEEDYDDQIKDKGKDKISWDETGDYVLNGNMTTGLNSPRGVSKKKTKVLEVRKGHRLDPLVRERSLEKPSKGGEEPVKNGVSTAIKTEDSAKGREESSKGGEEKNTKLFMNKAQNETFGLSSMKRGEDCVRLNEVAPQQINRRKSLFDSGIERRSNKTELGQKRTVVTRDVTREAFTTIETVIADPDNQVVCVVQSCPPRAPTDRRLLPRIKGKPRKKSTSMVPPLPAITEDEERGPQKSSRQDEYCDVEENDVTTDVKGHGNGTTADETREPLTLPPLQITQGKNGRRKKKIKNSDLSPAQKFKKALDALPSNEENEKLAKISKANKALGTLAPLKREEREKAPKKNESLTEDNIGMDLSDSAESFTSSEFVSPRKKEPREKKEKAPSVFSPRRNVFAPPSDREERIRKRLVEAEQSVARQQRDKVDNFFSQMIDTGHLDPMRKKREIVVPPVEESLDQRKNQKLPPLPTNQMGGTLGALMAVFRQEYPSLQGREGTYDTLKRCRYIRHHEIMNETEREEARSIRTSSWGKDALKA